MITTKKKRFSRSAEAFADALLDLMQTRPFQAVSVNEIIALSTYSKASFYRLFYDKYDLAKKIIARQVELYIDVLIRQMVLHADKQSAIEYSSSIALGTFTHVYHQQKFYKLILDNRFPDMGPDYFCEQAITLFKEKNPFSERRDLTVHEKDFFYYCTTHQVFRYICYWGKNHFQETPEEMADLVGTLVDLEKPGAVFREKYIPSNSVRS